MSLENKVNFFLKKGNPIFSIKPGQRSPKSFSQLHVKKSRFFRSYFLKKDDWLKAYAGPRLPTFPYTYRVTTLICLIQDIQKSSLGNQCSSNWYGFSSDMNVLSKFLERWNYRYSICNNNCDFSSVTTYHK